MSAPAHAAQPATMAPDATATRRLELVCPAGSLPALKAAVDNGADCVYMGLRNDTNARNFAGLNFDQKSATDGIRYARARGAKVLLALNTYAQPAAYSRWTSALDLAADLGVDAVILADAGLMQYARTAHPDLRLHLSVQASATTYEAIDFYVRHFGIRRAVLPRVLSLAQVEHVVRHAQCEIEVFAFGSLCVMVEGRCLLSSYTTGEGPNTVGACSPAKAVRWEPSADGLAVRLNGVLVDRYADGENAGYPVVCKGRYRVGGDTYYAIEEPTSLNTLELLPELLRMGIAAVKIEGRQRSPAYVAGVTRVWRAAIDRCIAEGAQFAPREEWTRELAGIAEGRHTTLGAYHRPWK
jgi:O2-independent ubiquinone biosynthesis protein UbiU